MNLRAVIAVTIALVAAVGCGDENKVTTPGPSGMPDKIAVPAGLKLDAGDDLALGFGDQLVLIDRTIDAQLSVWRLSDTTWQALPGVSDDAHRATGATVVTESASTSVLAVWCGAQDLDEDGCKPDTSEVQVASYTSGSWSRGTALTAKDSKVVASGGTARIIGDRDGAPLVLLSTTTPGVPPELWYAPTKDQGWKSLTTLSTATDYCTVQGGDLVIGLTHRGETIGGAGVPTELPYNLFAGTIETSGNLKVTAEDTFSNAPQGSAVTQLACTSTEVFIVSPDRIERVDASAKRTELIKLPGAGSDGLVQRSYNIGSVSTALVLRETSDNTSIFLVDSSGATTLAVTLASGERVNSAQATSGGVYALIGPTGGVGSNEIRLAK